MYDVWITLIVVKRSTAVVAVCCCQCSCCCRYSICCDACFYCCCFVVAVVVVLIIVFVVQCCFVFVVVVMLFLLLLLLLPRVTMLTVATAWCYFAYWESMLRRGRDVPHFWDGWGYVLRRISQPSKLPHASQDRVLQASISSRLDRG